MRRSLTGVRAERGHFIPPIDGRATNCRTLSHLALALGRAGECGAARPPEPCHASRHGGDRAAEDGARGSRARASVVIVVDQGVRTDVGGGERGARDRFPQPHRRRCPVRDPQPRARRRWQRRGGLRVTAPVGTVKRLLRTYFLVLSQSFILAPVPASQEARGPSDHGV